MAPATSEARTYRPGGQAPFEQASAQVGTFSLFAGFLSTQTSSAKLVIFDELSAYGKDARNSIERGLEQKGTIDKGSFSKYIE